MGLAPSTVSPIFSPTECDIDVQAIGAIDNVARLPFPWISLSQSTYGPAQFVAPSLPGHQYIRSVPERNMRKMVAT
jgi:hypothetical protein